VISDRDRFNRAMARFDAANGDDPNTEVYEGRRYPKELLYAQRMSAWLDKLAPDAPEALQLAARAQHIRRWAIPRSSYALGRTGYLQWRSALGKFHAETAGAILREVGYDEQIIGEVQSLLRKERLKLNPSTQLLEDAACLVFLEHYFADFAPLHEEAKVIEIVRKTWKKMSPRAHEAAGSLILVPAAQALVAKALGAT
jgi:hypothetical protein